MTPASPALSVPTHTPTIALPPTALAIASVGGSTGWVEGERATVRLAPASGVEIRLAGEPVVSRLDGGLGAVANAVTTPGLVRRERVGPDGPLAESVLVAPTLPLVWLQWSAGPGGRLPPLRLTLDPSWSREDGASEGGEHAGTTARLFRASGEMLVAWVTGDATLAVGGAEPSVLVLHPGRGDGTVVTLGLASGSGATLRGAVAAGAHAAAHTRRAVAEPEGGLVLRTGVTEVDEGVAWARLRLAGLIRRAAVEAPDAPPSLGGGGVSLLLAGLAALAAGDDEPARLLLAALPSGAPAQALLAGHLAAVTGDAGPAAALLDAFLAGAGSDPADAGPGRALRAVAAASLADGLRYAAPEARIADLRRFAGRETPLPPSGRRLPMAGRPRPGTPDAPGPERLRTELLGPWLTGLLAGNPRDPAPSAAPDVDALRGAAAAFVSNPDTAWGKWREVLTRGMERGSSGPGTWDDPDGWTAAGSTTAELVLTLTHGLLGYAPDAPVGRIRLAPRLPAHLRAFHVDGIGIGDARLRVEYTRDGAAHLWRVEPSVAPVPPLLVFEPRVAGSVASVRVDGAPAELEVRRSGVASIVPVQLPVDGARTVEIVTGEP